MANTARYIMLRKFQRDVEQETRRARGLFSPPGCHIERDKFCKAIWVSVIGEELGKLQRAVNKLTLAKDEAIREQWLDTAYEKIITTSSLLRRMAENLEKLPDR